MQRQETETIACSHFVSAVRCALFFSDRDKPKSQAELREQLRSDFPIERRRPDAVRKNGVEGYRPKRAYFQSDDATFVWQQGSAVYVQSEAPHDRGTFLKVLDSVVRACAATRPLNVEPLQMEVTVINRFEFKPYEVDQFELHRYFTIVPQPSAEIRKQSVFLFQNDVSLRYGDWGGDLIEMGLKFPAYGPGGSNGFIDLTITSQNPFVSTIDETVTCANKDFNSVEELTFDATTKELHQLLNWT